MSQGEGVHLRLVLHLKEKRNTVLAKDEKGNPLVKDRRLTAVTDKQIRELRITKTPQHPERELRAARRNCHPPVRERGLPPVPTAVMWAISSASAAGLPGVHSPEAG